MGFPQYRYTPGSLQDGYSPRREMLDRWAAAWTATIAEAAGGLDLHDRHEVYRIIHEIRKRVEAGDYGPPIGRYYTCQTRTGGLGCEH